MESDNRHDQRSRPFKIGHLLFGADQQVLRFVQSHIGMPFTPEGDYRCIGILSDDDMVVAGACFHGFFGTGAVLAGATSRPGRWATKGVMRGILAYGFESLDLHRLTCIVGANNTSAIRWCRKVGFVEEGRLREANEGDVDAILFGLLKRECRWLNGHLRQRRVAA